jgi:hypothetical protein
MIAAKLLLPPLDAPRPYLVVRFRARAWAIPLTLPMRKGMDARPPLLRGRSGKGFPTHLLQDAAIWAVFLLIACMPD